MKRFTLFISTFVCLCSLNAYAVDSEVCAVTDKDVADAKEGLL
mgnify:CR=1 FL=1